MSQQFWQYKKQKSKRKTNIFKVLLLKLKFVDEVDINYTVDLKKKQGT